MAKVYEYAGTAVDTSATVKKKTNYSEPLHVLVTGTSVLADAVKVQIKNNQDVFLSTTNLEFGEGFNSVNLPQGVEYQIDVNNGGSNPIVVDVWG